MLVFPLEMRRDWVSKVTKAMEGFANKKKKNPLDSITKKNVKLEKYLKQM